VAAVGELLYLPRMSMPTPDPRTRRLDIAILAGILVAAAWLRLGGLSDWWLNPDEGIYYSTVTRADFSAFWEEVTANAHPPLYYLLLRMLGAVTWDFVAFRMLSVAGGLVAVGVAWVVARRLSGDGTAGRVAGVVAATLVALSPGAVEQSQVMRPYMIQLALLGGALYFLLRLLDEGRGLPAYVAFTLLALLTHYSSMLALGAFGLIILHDGWRRGMGRPEWRALVAVHALPALVLAGVYLWHLRPLMDSTLADDALDGWLAPYMIGSPGAAWFAFLGFQHILASPWFRGPLAILTLAVLATRVDGRWPSRPAIVVGSALLVAVAAASLGAYPFGSTRHSTWVLAFVVPGLGWAAGRLVTEPRRRAVALGAGVGVLLAFGGVVGPMAGTHRAPWPPDDRVVRQTSVARMFDVLDPDGTPELIVMSAQSFYLFVPFYAEEREHAVRSDDGRLFHFPLGQRSVLVSEAWDFTFGQELPDHTDLGSTLARAELAFPELGLSTHTQAVLWMGGWRPAVLDALVAASAERPFIVGQRSEPGIWAFLVDLPALREGALRR